MRENTGPVTVYTFAVYKNGKHIIHDENTFLTRDAAFTWARGREAELMQLPGVAFAGSLGVDPDTHRSDVERMLRASV